MIYVKLKGRLGNQLFYYAMARYISEQRNQCEEIVFLPEKCTYDKFGGVSLIHFNIQKYSVKNKYKLNFVQNSLYYLFQALRKILYLLGKPNYQKFTTLMQPLLQKYGIYCMSGNDSVEIKAAVSPKNILISGVWENPQYFSGIRSILVNEIVPKHSVLLHNAGLMQEIKDSNSACISIRKGDFLNEGNEAFNICSNQYYYSAVEMIKDRVGKCSLYIFSDDIEWCKINLSFDCDVVFENNGEDNPVWEKLRIMSACKHFIISNSTFSWWAQYLSISKNKVVIAPRPWRKDEYCDYLYDKSFIVLDAYTGQFISLEHGEE